MSPAVDVPREIADRARRSMQRMLDVGRASATT
jgi:quinolinate synthase